MYYYSLILGLFHLKMFRLWFLKEKTFTNIKKVDFNLPV